MAIQPIDAHLCETTVLAIVLYANTGLEIQSISKTGCTDIGQQLATHHLDERSTAAAQHLVLVARHYDLLQAYHIGQEFELHLHHAIANHLYGFGGADITSSRGFYAIFAFTQVFDEIMTRGVRGCNDWLALLRKETDGTEGKMLAVFLYHVSRYVCICGYRRNGVGIYTQPYC